MLDQIETNNKRSCLSIVSHKLEDQTSQNVLHDSSHAALNPKKKQKRTVLVILSKMDDRSNIPFSSVLLSPHPVWPPYY